MVLDLRGVTRGVRGGDRHVMRTYEDVSGPGSACRVLLVADDRRFRALAATLLSRRGYTVLICARACDLADVARREAADVVVLDASASLTRAAREAARLSSLEPPVAIVAVSTGGHSGLAALPVVSKWGPAEALFAAIEHAWRQVVRTEDARADDVRDARTDEVTHVAF